MWGPGGGSGREKTRSWVVLPSQSLGDLTLLPRPPLFLRLSHQLGRAIIVWPGLVTSQRFQANGALKWWNRGLAVERRRPVERWSYTTDL